MPHEHHLRELLHEAAIEAEQETGYHEPTEAEASRSIIRRTIRMGAGFAVLVAGIIMLPLPGPGMLVVAAGLVILSRDVAWADRVLQHVRHRIPTDEDGKIPRSSIVTMVMLGLAGVAASVWFTFR